MNTTTSPQHHWDDVYARKPAEGVSWYRPHLERSLALIDAARLPRDAAILDVGGGASTLVDDLLDRGYTNVSVLDLYLAVTSRWGPRRRGFYAAAPSLAEVVRRVDAHPPLAAFWAERMPFAEGWEG